MDLLQMLISPTNANYP